MSAAPAALPARYTGAYPETSDRQLLRAIKRFARLVRHDARMGLPYSEDADRQKLRSLVSEAARRGLEVPA